MAEDYIDDQCAVVAKLSASYGKPVVGASFCTRDEPFVRELQDGGVPVLPSPERAIKACCPGEYARERPSSKRMHVRAIVNEPGVLRPLEW
jgi:acyl-CoA synthetase (NDP forming)